MSFLGHIEKGMVVLDEPVQLEDGVRVLIEPVEEQGQSPKPMPLRGTPFSYTEPFEPAIDSAEWEAAS